MRYIWLKVEADSFKEREIIKRKFQIYKQLKCRGFDFDGIDYDEHGMLRIKTTVHCTELYDAFFNGHIEDKIKFVFGGEK